MLGSAFILSPNLYALVCTNDSADIGILQSAVDTGGTISISGICLAGTSSIFITNPVTITGNAILQGTGGSVFMIYSDDVTISGLTFISTGIYVRNALNGVRSNLRVTNNVFRDFTSAGQPSGIGVDGILSHSVISRNQFSNFWPNGFSYNGPNSGELRAASGIQVSGGLDETTVTDNTFDAMGADAVHIFFAGMIGNSGGFTGINVSISNNTFTRVHRMAIEIQGTGDWPNGCPGGCTNRVPVTSLIVAGNFVHLPAWPYYNTYGLSLMEGSIGSNDQFVNNTVIAEANSPSPSQPGYGMETPCCSTGELIQGNVIASALPNNLGWDAAIQNYSPGSLSNREINNVLCGPPSGPGVSKIAGNGANISIANWISNTTCPGTTSAALSSIDGTFTSPNSIEVVSNLSIRSVQFYLDGSSAPAATQQISDVNDNFTNDRKWLYHVDLTAGSHSVKAMITDAAGTIQTISNNSIQIPAGWTQIISKNSNKCMDVNGASTDSGAIVQQYDCWEGDNQKFMFTAVSGGYEITVKNSGLQLDIWGGPSAIQNGALLHQYPYWGGTNEIFQVNPTADGYYTISPIHSGKCLDVNGLSTDNFVPIQQWDCWGGDNQKWLFVPDNG